MGFDEVVVGSRRTLDKQHIGKIRGGYARIYPVGEFRYTQLAASRPVGSPAEGQIICIAHADVLVVHEECRVLFKDGCAVGDHVVPQTE